MVFLNGDAIPEPDAAGRRITDDHFLLLFNAHTEQIDFTLPPRRLRQQLAGPARHPGRRRSISPGAAGGRGRSTRSRRTPLVVLSTSAVPEPERRQATERAKQAAPKAAQRSQ